MIQGKGAKEHHSSVIPTVSIVYSYIISSGAYKYFTLQVNITFMMAMKWFIILHLNFMSIPFFNRVTFVLQLYRDTFMLYVLYVLLATEMSVLPAYVYYFA